MYSKTNEQALEAAIEKHLTGTCLEELKEQAIEIDAANENDTWELCELPQGRRPMKCK